MIKIWKKLKPMEILFGEWHLKQVKPSMQLHVLSHFILLLLFQTVCIVWMLVLKMNEKYSQTNVCSSWITMLSLEFLVKRILKPEGFAVCTILVWPHQWQQNNRCDLCQKKKLWLISLNNFFAESNNLRYFFKIITYIFFLLFENSLCSS